MKLLLDADVLLDVALNREQFAPDSHAVVKWCHERPGAAVAAWHTISNVYYVLRPAQGNVTARKFISDLLAFCDVAVGGTQAVRRALTLQMNDFDDALQVAAAASACADWIVSRNVRDYRGSPIPVLQPRDFLSRIQRS